MKILIKILLLLIPVLGFSQKKASPEKISKSKLTEAQLITDLVKDVPVDCKVTGYKFTIKTYNKVAEEKVYSINCVGNELRLEIESAFKKANIGDKFSFDKMETACLDKHKKKYSFIITE